MKSDVAKFLWLLVFIAALCLCVFFSPAQVYAVCVRTRVCAHE